MAVCNTICIVFANMRLAQTHNSDELFLFSLYGEVKECVNLITKTGHSGVEDLRRSLYMSNRKIKSVCMSTSSIAQKSLSALYVHAVLICFIYLYISTTKF